MSSYVPPPQRPRPDIGIVVIGMVAEDNARWLPRPAGGHRRDQGTMNRPRPIPV